MLYRQLRKTDVNQPLRLTSKNASGCTNFDPGGSEDDQKVGDLADSEQCAAEYQAERSADITHQSQHRVRRFCLDVFVLQLRVKHLVKNTNMTVHHIPAICANTMFIVITWHWS